MKTRRFYRRRSARPADKTENASRQEAERLRVTDEILDKVLHERQSKVSAARLLEESRR